MPITFQPKTPIHGIAMSSALKGEQGTVCVRAIYSSDDGAEFFHHVEAIWGYFGSRITTLPSVVDNFLAILPPRGEVTMYCNELFRIEEIRAKVQTEAGQRITKDHIAEINRVVFNTVDGKTIEIPSDSGVVIIMSHGWRKSIFYDFEPLTGPKRTIDIGKLLGRQMCGMSFQELYSITDEQWSRMIGWGWFPFIGLSDADRGKIIAFSTREDEPREILREVCENYLSSITERLKSWHKKNILQDHIPFLESALKRLQDDDFIACISTLYPRIEGAMRSLTLIENSDEFTGQSTMVDNLAERREEYSLLLPSRFKQYLREFYFRSFNYVEGDLPLSRHTVGHGLSRAEDYDLENATLGFLIFDQMFYYLN